MKVFLSWSGEQSKAVATALYGWLPVVIQSCKPWMSADIDAGKKWFVEVSRQLADASIGIVCLTPENQASPWVNFESGAIAKQMGDSTHLCPYLFQLEPTDVKAPLSLFQAKRATEEDTLALVRMINRAGSELVSAEVLSRSFKRNWPDLEEELRRIPSAGISTPRNPSEKLDEVLSLVRTIARDGSSIEELRRVAKKKIHELSSRNRVLTSEVSRLQALLKEERKRSKVAELELMRYRGKAPRADRTVVMQLPTGIPEDASDTADWTSLVDELDK